MKTINIRIFYWQQMSNTATNTVTPLGPWCTFSENNPYHNCDVDSFFATDEQFQYGMNVDFIRLTNAHFRQQVKMAASLSRTFHTSNIVIVAVILIIITGNIDALFTADHQF